MKLLNIEGMNCFTASLINLATCWGADYGQIFCGLWSENNFSYNPVWEVYNSKKLITNLENCGIKLSNLDLQNKYQLQQNLLQLEVDTFLVMGMDAFDVPWSPIYKLMHNPHYFVAHKTDGCTLTCYDPTYETQGMPLTVHHAALHAFDLICTSKTVQNTKPPSIFAEAYEYLATLPALKRKMKNMLCDKTATGKALFSNWAKYANCHMNNRYLFKYYLQQISPKILIDQTFLSLGFFSRWAAFKNGLYKAALVKDNTSLLIELEEMLNNLLNEEIIFANTVIEKTLGKHSRLQT